MGNKQPAEIYPDPKFETFPLLPWEGWVGFVESTWWPKNLTENYGRIVTGERRPNLLKQMKFSGMDFLREFDDYWWYVVTTPDNGITMIVPESLLCDVREVI